MNESMINLLGIELIKYINIDLMTSKRIIRMAMKDIIKKDKFLNLNDVLFVFRNNLNKLLKSLKIPDNE